MSLGLGGRIRVINDMHSHISVAPFTQEILVQISCSSSEGAALILPNGASSQDLTPLARFRNHAHDYGTDWFNLLEKWGFAGRKFYLITGCHKSSAWGVTFSGARSTQGDVNMALGSCSIGGKIGYSWENSSDSESSHAGPLREPAEKDWGENQSVFIRGYIIVKRDRLGSLLRKPIEVKAIGGSRDIKSTLGRAWSGNSPGTSGGSHGSNTSASNHGGGGASQSHLAISVEQIPGTSVVSLSTALGFLNQHDSPAIPSFKRDRRLPVRQSNSMIFSPGA
jgi:hypothetical protein